MLDEDRILRDVLPVTVDHPAENILAGPPEALLAKISSAVVAPLSRRRLLSRTVGMLAGAAGAFVASLALPRSVAATCLIYCVALPGCPADGCIDSYQTKCYNSCEHYYFYACHQTCTSWCYFQGC